MTKIESPKQETVNTPENGEAIRKQREFYVELGREIIVNRSKEIFIDFDVEGDGPAGYGSLASIGAVAPTGERFYVEVRPQTTESLLGPREFCDGLGLTHEYLEANGVSIEEAGRRFKQWVDELKQKYKKPAVAVAFNAGYDWAHIDLAFARASVVFPGDFPRKEGAKQPQHNPFGVAPFDTKSLAMALPRPHQEGLTWSWRETAKNNLPEEVSPDLEFTHNALEDSIYQQQQHFAMVGMLSQGKDPDLDKLIQDRIELQDNLTNNKYLGAIATSTTES